MEASREIKPSKTAEQLHSELVDASRVWVHLRDRVARTGERDAKLLSLRNNQMTHIDTLLEHYAGVLALDEICDGR